MDRGQECFQGGKMIEVSKVNINTVHADSNDTGISEITLEIKAENEAESFDSFFNRFDEAAVLTAVKSALDSSYDNEDNYEDEDEDEDEDEEAEKPETEEKKWIIPSGGDNSCRFGLTETQVKDEFSLKSSKNKFYKKITQDGKINFVFFTSIYGESIY